MMQLGSYLYIKRHWEEDQIKMAKAIDFFTELNTKFSLLIFPEGTDLTPQTKANSDRFADKMGLPVSQSSPKSLIYYLINNINYLSITTMFYTQEQPASAT